MQKKKLRKVIKINKTVREGGKPETSENRVFKTYREKDSFLVEIEYNHDIKPKTRKEIESRFKKSQINASYVFPRTIDPELITFPQITLEPMPSRNKIAYKPKDHSKSIINTSLNQEDSSFKKYKIPSLAKKYLKIRNSRFHSITPTPYHPGVNRISLTRLQQSRRNTPSPVSRLKHL